MEAKQRELLKYISDAGQKRPGSRLGKEIYQEIRNFIQLYNIIIINANYIVPQVKNQTANFLCTPLATMKLRRLEDFTLQKEPYPISVSKYFHGNFERTIFISRKFQKIVNVNAAMKESRCV